MVWLSAQFLPGEWTGKSRPFCVGLNRSGLSTCLVDWCSPPSIPFTSGVVIQTGWPQSLVMLHGQFPFAVGIAMAAQLGHFWLKLLSFSSGRKVKLNWKWGDEALVPKLSDNSMPSNQQGGALLHNTLRLNDQAPMHWNLASPVGGRLIVLALSSR